MKYRYKLTKEDYINFMEFSDSIPNGKKIRNPVKILLRKLGKSQRLKKYENYVNNNIRKDLLGSRELTIEKGVLKINDMRIERILVPNEIKEIYKLQNYFFILLKTDQSFIVENRSNILLKVNFEGNGFKIAT